MMKVSNPRVVLIWAAFSETCTLLWPLLSRLSYKFSYHLEVGILFTFSKSCKRSISWQFYCLYQYISYYLHYWHYLHHWYFEQVKKVIQKNLRFCLYIVNSCKPWLKIVLTCENNLVYIIWSLNFWWKIW